MISDFLVFTQFREQLEKFRYIANHAYLDLDSMVFMFSILENTPLSKISLSTVDRVVKRTASIVSNRLDERQIDGPREFLGSSARLTELTGEDYYRQRYADEEKGVPPRETWDLLMHVYKIKGKSPIKKLNAFEYWYSQGKYGPRAAPKDINGNSQANQNLEARINHDKFELIPHQYWDRLPEPFRQRVKYFIEEDIRRADLMPEQQQELLCEIRDSKWYKTLNGHQLSNSQFYAFFDDILLDLVSGNVPNRKKIQEMFDDVIKPNWREKGISKVKPPLTLSAYEQLSFYEGKSDEWILDRYVTSKPNSVRAYKAWITMRHGEKKTKDNLGNRVALLITQRKTKQQIMEEVGVTDYQYRGFLAAYKRGAYRKLLREQQQAIPTPRIYVDSHGVVHVNPRNAGDIEKGYK